MADSEGESRWRHWSIVAAAVAFPLPAAFIALKSYRAELSGFRPHRHPVPLSPETARLEGLELVTFSSRRGDTLRGWYVPSRNRSAIVLTHGAGTDRREVFPEAGLLARLGFGVLMFDWPGHGESHGEVHWDQGERDALTAAVDWISTRPDVDPGRVGAYGFSMGGYVLAQVAALDERIRAVALAGTPSDPVEHTRWEYRRWGPVSQIPALWAVRRGGMPARHLLPKEVIARVAPRPVLVVSGDRDAVVPLSMAKRLFDACRSPKTFLLVEGAGHGAYLRDAPEVFAREVSAFFEEALLGQTPGLRAS